MPAFTARMAGVWTITAPSESEAADLRDEAFACWLRNCAPPEGVTFEGDDGPAFVTPPDVWFEVHSGDRRTADWFRTEDGEKDPYSYSTIEEAREAIREAREEGEGAGAYCWIVRVTSEKVEDVP